MNIPYRKNLIYILLLLLLALGIVFFKNNKVHLVNSDNDNSKPAVNDVVRGNPATSDSNKDRPRKLPISYKSRELDVRFQGMSELIKADGTLTQNAFDLAGVPEESWKAVQERLNASYNEIRQLIIENTVLVSADDNNYKFVVKKFNDGSSIISQKLYDDIVAMCGHYSADALTNMLDNTQKTFMNGKMDVNITMDKTNTSESLMRVEFTNPVDGSGGFSSGPVDDFIDDYGSSLYNHLLDQIKK